MDELAEITVARAIYCVKDDQDYKELLFDYRDYVGLSLDDRLWCEKHTSDKFERAESIIRKLESGDYDE